MSTRLLSCAISAFLFSASTVTAQGGAKAASCFYSIDFENGIPPDWEVTQVERQTPGGEGLGESVPAFTTGNATDANADGFFPVPDIPIGNHFAMANDDAAPCNCDMSDVTLTSSTIDLSTRSGLAMQCRVFHEQALGGGPAFFEVSVNGGNSWIPMATIPVLSGDWQYLFVNLSAFDGQPDVRLRFRWSDGGTWASGFAVDDLCLRERNTHDLVILQVFANDPGGSPFDTEQRSLRYRLLPLDQAAPMTVAVEVQNLGTSTLIGIQASFTLRLNGSDNGPFEALAVDQLAPGERTWLTVATDWTPDAMGELEVIASVMSDADDDDMTDNTATELMHITGPGWENGYGAMACDEGVIQGAVGGAQNFVAAVRMELIAGGTTPGISVVLGGNSQVGEQVRGILLDANLAFVDTTMRHTLTDEDIDLAGQGAPLYLSFADPVSINAGDLFVGVQHLDGNGEVFVATSGVVPIGATLLMQGTSFDVTYLRAAPMVRLHFADFGVGMAEQHIKERDMDLQIYPVPMAGPGRIRFELKHATRVELRMADISGRFVQSTFLGGLPAGIWEGTIDVSGLAEGSYVLGVLTDGGMTNRVFVVSRDH